MVGAIEFSGVKKSFRRPDGEIVHALNGVDLKIEQGDFVCLIGPSGCGKSTMLRLLAGLDQPTEGAVYLDGEKITRPNYDRGLVFQDPNLFPWLNIYDNISFGLRARHIFKQKRDSVREFMDLVGLTGFEKSYPHQLSGGMCQRASLARALIGHPKALLLDEPLGAGRVHKNEHAGRAAAHQGRAEHDHGDGNSRRRRSGVPFEQDSCNVAASREDRGDT